MAEAYKSQKRVHFVTYPSNGFIVSLGILIGSAGASVAVGVEEMVVTGGVDVTDDAESMPPSLTIAEQREILNSSA